MTSTETYVAYHLNYWLFFFHSNIIITPKQVDQHSSPGYCFLHVRSSHRILYIILLYQNHHDGKLELDCEFLAGRVQFADFIIRDGGSYTYPFLLSMMSFFDLVRPFFSNRRLFIAGCFLNIQRSKQFSTTIGL